MAISGVIVSDNLTTIKVNDAVKPFAQARNPYEFSNWSQFQITDGLQLRTDNSVKFEVQNEGPLANATGFQMRLDAAWVMGAPPNGGTGTPISGLWGTGRNATGKLSFDGDDANWKVFLPGTTVAIPAKIVAPEKTPVGFWLDPGGSSGWIGPSADQTANAMPVPAAGDYRYQTTFSLPSNFASARVAIRIASDNGCTGIKLINSAGIALPLPENGCTFSRFKSDYEIASGFQAGQNILEITVNNSAPGPTGLRVELSGTYTLAGGATLPRITPNAGSGAANVTQSLTVESLSPSAIFSTEVLFRDAALGTNPSGIANISSNACQIETQYTGAMFLANDAGVMSPLAWPGTAGVPNLENSQCLVDIPATSVSFGTTTLVNLKMRFKSPWNGKTLQIFLRTKGPGGSPVGPWQAAGTFTVQSVTRTLSGTVTGTTGVSLTIGTEPTPAVTDSNGNYLRSGLGAQTYRVTPSKTGFTFAPTFFDANLVSGDAIGVNFTATAIPPGPTLPRVTPNAGTGGTGGFQTFAVEGAAPATITAVEMVFQDSTSGTVPQLANACYIQMTSSGAARVADNSGNLGANYSWLGGPSATSPDNGQCLLDGPGSSIVLSATTTWNLRLNFKAAWAGKSLKIFLRSQDASYQWGGWQERGSFTLTGGGGTTTLPRITPNAGSGAVNVVQSLTVEAVNPSTIQSTEVLFRDAALGATPPQPLDLSTNACQIETYSSGFMYVTNDAGVQVLSGWPGTIGAPSLENSQCSLDIATTSVSFGATTMTINLKMRFKSTWAGKSLRIFLRTKAVGGSPLPWQAAGTFTVQ
jgi:hypothetical protein